MGGDSGAPKQSDEEKSALSAQAAALQQQSDILKSSYEQQQLLAPVLYKQLGITPKYDKAGKIIGYSEAANPNKSLQEELTGKLLQRQKDALEGKLPIDPNLTDELGTQERTLRETLFKQLGSGYETSSPGIEALAKFGKNKANLYDSASRGDLSLAEQLALAHIGSTQGQTQQTLGGTLSLGSTGYNAAAGFGGNAAGYQNPLSYYANLREQQQQAEANSNAGIGSFLGAIGKLAGTVGSASATGGGSLFGNLFA